MELPKVGDNSGHCYCGTWIIDQGMLTCDKCKKYFHIGCLSSGRPSSLDGDIFFQFTCSICNHGDEECERMKLQWLQAVHLTLYNLQLSGSGKFGYFRWKEHICAFIDKHWITLFGNHKKKTSLWYGTVAGTLSSWCPHYFLSGAQELGEPGWWRLVDMKPPSLKTELLGKVNRKKHESTSEPIVKVEGLRSRRSKTSIEAAMELKAKRSTVMEAKEIRKALGKSGDTLDNDLPQKQERPSDDSPMIQDVVTVPIKQENDDEGTLQKRVDPPGGQSSWTDIRSEMDADSQWSHSSQKSDQWLTEKELQPHSILPQFLLTNEADTDDSDMDIDPGTISPPGEMAGITRDSPTIQDMLAAMDDSCQSLDNTEFPMAAKSKYDPQKNVLDTPYVPAVDMDVPPDTPIESQADDDDGVVSSDSDSDDERSVVTDQKPLRKRRGKQEDTKEEKVAVSYIPMSVYEERLLLRRLNALSEKTIMPAHLNRLRRKLIVRQIKRERGLPIFDVDAIMNDIVRKYGGKQPSITKNVHQYLNPYNVPTSRFSSEDVRILDRYQSSLYPGRSQTRQCSSFLTRLVGTDDDQLQGICSPYTARLLKPFIRRDYETKPKKLKLLEEICAFPHRKETDWKPEPAPPIDYCYVRPQHIPSVNTLCREFFWPGVDLSDCLQYPDYSCVVLYRKLVIGFAFMVPDVKYNEAYISFIFCHPEWRQAGIATFMLYHLIQTCMGKDITLHVSATNAAMVMYQKFGFKPEEFILDFYDKYYPEDTKECKHAFCLRLRR